jgi:hypothetical protein
MENGLNAADLQTYSYQQVAGLADVDFYAVRDEGYRRQRAAEKAFARAQKALAKAQEDMQEAGVIIQAALNEQRRSA